MTFPVPSAKLFTTETSAIGGKVDDNAKAVANLHITPSKERLLKKKEEPVQVQYRTGDDNTPKVYNDVNTEEEYVPKVYAADDEDEDEENPYTEVNTESKYECFYRTVLEAYMNNPIFVKKFILFKTSVLQEFIRVLTEADSVEVTISEDVECCGKTTKINTVDSIIVVKDSVRSDFQVSPNEWYTLFKDYKISLKYTLDD